MTEPAAPIVNGVPKEIAEGVYVVPDGRVPLVPNVGIVLGADRLLVVDTAMGPANGARIRTFADVLAGGRELILTITHFHPEHGFGAQAFRDGRIVYNRSQLDEFREKGQSYLELFLTCGGSGAQRSQGVFRRFGEWVAEQPEGVEFVEPDEACEADAHMLAFGGRSVELRT